MKKRVLHVLASNKFSGAENVACTIIENDDKYDMFYSCPSGPIEDTLKERKIKYICLKSFTPFEINRICKKYKIDIIHAHDMKASFIVSLANKKYRKISTIHANYDFNSRKTIFSMAFREIIKRFYKIICVSQEIYDNAVFIDDITRNKFIVISNVVKRKEILDKSNEFKTKKYDLIYLGRLTKVKRPEWVVDITKDVVKKYPKFKVAMIGSGDLDLKIRNLISDYGLNDNIDCLGFKSNPFPYVRNSKIAILTSEHEGLPMSVVECMSLGVPVLNTGVGGLRNLFENYSDFVCTSKDSFVNKIDSILSGNINLKQNCSEIIKDSTNIDNYIERINDVYEPKIKHILQVIGSMNTGGMESLVMNFYRNIDKNKFQYDFLVNDFSHFLYEDEIISLGGKIFRALPRKPYFFRNKRDVNRVFDYNNIDIVHAHQGITYYYPLKAARKRGVKKIIIHNHGINRYFLKYLKLYNNLWARNRISGLSDEHIAITEDVANQIFSNKVMKRKDYVVMNNAIDPNKFKFNSKIRDKKRKELNLGRERTFIHIGNFNRFKNYDFLIDVFKEYLKYDNKAKFLIIGTGPIESEVKERVKNLGINKNVMFLGKRSDISELLSAADIMIFPSYYEGYPMALIEAQASGINILASNTINHECKICDNYKYLSIENPKLWVDEINKIKENKNREKYASVVNNSNYSINKTIRFLEQLYEK